MIMGSTEILLALRKSGEKLTSLEIATISNSSIASVNQGLNRLKKDISENLRFRRLTMEEKESKYGHKLGCRVNIFWLDE